MKYQIILVLIFISINTCLSASVNKYVLDEVKIESAFVNSIDQTETLSILTQPETNVVSNIILSDEGKSKVVAGVLGIMCGAFGAHRFYLGHKKAGLIYLGITVCSFTILGFVPGTIGLVDGILYLIAKDEEFNGKYVNNDKLIQWNS